jgi:hypothetical protein
MRMFGRPQGLLGRLGGIILARANRPFAQEVVALLDVRGLGEGPGSRVRARGRYRAAGRGGAHGKDRGHRSFKGDGRAGGKAECCRDQGRCGGLASRHGGKHAVRGRCLRHRAGDQLDAGLARHEGRTAGDTPSPRPRRQSRARLHADLGAAKAGVTEMLASAGFDDARLVDLRGGFCALARKA